MASQVVLQSIFGEEFLKIFDENVKPVLLEASAPQEAVKSNSEEWTPKNDNKLSCSHCRIEFQNLHQQREHFRLDWHRYNLKQSLSSKQPLSEEEFVKKNDNDDISSISGSDTEEEETLDIYATALGKIFLENQSRQVFSMYRCLLFNKKEEQQEINLYERFRNNCYDSKQWTILMLGGGHFAGAVFRGSEPILHKTFHCYTVRAGQGGSQSSKDNKAAGSGPKSAGSSLRRYNEQALVQHVTSIVSLWSKEIKESSLIIYRASGPYNKSVLFGGKESLLDRSSTKLCTIPFSTGRATFSEVKRVHALLSQAEVYENLEDAATHFLKQKSPENTNKRNKVRASAINRAKSRDIIERPLPGQYTRENSVENVNQNEKRDSRDPSPEMDSENLETNDLEISFEDLKEFEDSLTPEQRRIGQTKKRSRKSKTQKIKEKEDARKKQLMDILIKGDVISLKELLNERLKDFVKETISEIEICSEFINEVIDEHGNTFLHVACLNEHEDLIKYLLEKEANPCAKNKNNQTPYSCSNSQISREVLKTFAKENPEKYNYNKAQIPVSTKTDEEIEERKKAQRKIKREKEKEKKKENAVKQKEELEKNRFLVLSDREKRALAAERRILDAQGKVTARCFLCASDMAGKVPFEYDNNRFCSVECLKAHRLKNTVPVTENKQKMQFYKNN